MRPLKTFNLLVKNFTPSAARSLFVLKDSPKAISRAEKRRPYVIPTILGICFIIFLSSLILASNAVTNYDILSSTPRDNYISFLHSYLSNTFLLYIAFAFLLSIPLFHIWVFSPHSPMPQVQNLIHVAHLLPISSRKKSYLFLSLPYFLLLISQGFICSMSLALEIAERSSLSAQITLFLIGFLVSNLTFFTSLLFHVLFGKTKIGVIPVVISFLIFSYLFLSPWEPSILNATQLLKLEELININHSFSALAFLFLNLLVTLGIFEFYYRLKIIEKVQSF